ncbi:hypothetical protein HMPREF0908_1336 [Selenomonas flueggei ATCC 43531]|uniref:Uncharacterized protein n=2 Tax=Selenomonas TaxID=970 RepID=C4V492_9FIRM|nr:hypothetical protein HMPREF0908_1336 [Selenomonas flueggei ATCC 43531]
MALLFSVIAALIVFLTGLLSDARLVTALVRSLLAFVCAGVFTYLVTFILEAKGWAAFDKVPEERMKDMQQLLYDTDDIDFDAEDDDEADVEAFASSKDFQPLSEERFVHMKTPPAEEDRQDKDTSEAAPA